MPENLKSASSVMMAEVKELVMELLVLQITVVQQISCFFELGL